MRTILKTVCIILLLFFTSPTRVIAQSNEKIIDGKIVSINTVHKEFVGQILPISVIEVKILSGDLKNQILSIDQPPSQKDNFFSVGDRVLVSASKIEDQEPMYYIVDVVRTDSLAILFFIFIALSVTIAGWHGLRSIGGLALSLLILIKFVIPRLYEGHDPVLTAVTGAFLIAPVTFYLTHGFSKKTTIALVGTAIGLLITAVLAQWFIVLGKLTGYASEEVQFLQIAKSGTLNPLGLLLAGIIIGTLGILDDVTISQASIVAELYKVNNKLTRLALFVRAMRVGRDHIAATINTLVLVYTGASLPLLLLFLNSSQPLTYLINYEIIAEEIIRSLIGSIGLILTVPITTAIAVFMTVDVTKKSK